MPSADGSYSSREYFEQFLTDDGSASGDNDFAKNFSVTPGVAFVTIPTDSIVTITNFQLLIAATSFDMETQGYGTNIALTNGMTVETIQNGITKNLSYQKIFTNIDLMNLGGSSNERINWSGQGDSFTCNIDFLPMFGKNNTVRLNGNTGDSLGVLLNDNFGLRVNTQQFIVRGFI